MSRTNLIYLAHIAQLAENQLANFRGLSRRGMMDHLSRANISERGALAASESQLSFPARSGKNLLQQHGECFQGPSALVYFIFLSYSGVIPTNTLLYLYRIYKLVQSPRGPWGHQ